jgi:sugar phosphate isomerase/epimerase
MNTIHRRAFLRQSVGTALGLAAVLPAAAIEPLTRKGPPRLRVSLAAYSFRDALTAKDEAKRITLFDFLDFCAAHHCDAAEMTSYYFPKEVTDDFLHQIKRHAYLHGVAFSGTSVGNSFARPDGPDLDRDLALTKAWVDHAVVLGAPYVRVFAGDPKGMDPAAAQRQVIRCLEECGAYAGARGVFLGLENHGGAVAHVAEVLEIVRAVKGPWFGLNLDIGNFDGLEDPYGQMAQLAPFAINVHFKVEVPRPGGGHQTTDPARVVKILREAGYQGYAALEYEGSGDPWKDVPEWLERMRTAFAPA